MGPQQALGNHLAWLALALLALPSPDYNQAEKTRSMTGAR
jgi:hypothetical protein